MRAVVVICCKGPPFIRVKWPSDLLMLGTEVEESSEEQHVGIVNYMNMKYKSEHYKKHFLFYPRFLYLELVYIAKHCIKPILKQ